MNIANWLNQKKYQYDVFLRPFSFFRKTNIILRKLMNNLPWMSAPNTLILGVTDRCQLDCVHCGIERSLNSSKKELSSEEVIKVIFQAYKLGVYFVNFTGGEPLLREDISELVEYTAKKGLITAVSTNALLLTREKIRQLKNRGLTFINISIDSSYPKIHDKFRKRIGLFEKAKKAISMCVEENITVFVSVCVSKENICRKDEIPSIIKLARELKAKGVVLLFAIPGGKWLNSCEMMLSQQEKKYINGLLDPCYVHLEAICSYYSRCNAVLKKLFYVSPYGDIQPCNFVPLRFGNVRENSLVILWRKMNGHLLYKVIDSSDCVMRNQQFRKRYIDNAI